MTSIRARGLALARVAAATVALASGCGRFGFDASALTSSDGGAFDAATGERDSGALDAGADADLDASPDEVDAALTVDAGFDAGVSFDAGMCTESPCRLAYPQCGCAPGAMCQRATAGSTVRSCVAAGTVAEGEGCTFSVDCVPGTGCLRAGTPSGQCSRWCNTSSDCVADDCMQLVAGSDVGSCSSSCDPFGEGSTGCPPTLRCRLALGARAQDGASAHGAICAIATGAALLASCTNSLECAPGLYCAASVCRAICRGAADCPGAACTPVTPAFRGLGVCT